jgi:hypothetical protein
MSNTNINGSKLLVAALLGLGALGFSGISAKADVTGQLNQCRASTKGKVIQCCETILKTGKKPFWFTENKKSCGSAVVCVRRNPSETAVLVEGLAPQGINSKEAPLAEAPAPTPKKKPTCYIAMDIPVGGGGAAISTVAKLRGR